MNSLSLKVIPLQTFVACMSHKQQYKSILSSQYNKPSWKWPSPRMTLTLNDLDALSSYCKLFIGDFTKMYLLIHTIWFFFLLETNLPHSTKITYFNIWRQSLKWYWYLMTLKFNLICSVFAYILLCQCASKRSIWYHTCHVQLTFLRWKLLGHYIATILKMT